MPLVFVSLVCWRGLDEGGGGVQDEKSSPLNKFPIPNKRRCHQSRYYYLSK